MPDIDTSSYPRPQQNQNPLDVAGKLQSLQSNALTIDQQKLKLANDHFQIVNGALGSLLYKPDLTADDIVGESQKLVNLGLMTPDHFSQFVSAIPGKSQLQKDPQALQKYLTVTRNQALSNMEALNWYGGQGAGFADTGATVQPYNVRQGVVTPTGAPIAKSLPVTTPGFEPPSKQFPSGREAPIGAPNLPAQPQGPSSGFYGQAPAQNQMSGGVVSGATSVSTTTIRKPTASAQPSRLPIQSTEPEPIRQPDAFESTTFANQFDAVNNKPLAGSSPFGFKNAEDVAGQASGEQLAKARNDAGNFQRQIFPLTQAIPALEKLGTKGTGPGTETINQLKSFVLSNVPGVKESDFNGTVKDYDKAKKYLTDFVNQTGNSGTNDKLAASFAGNPSVNISNAAAVDVAKSALALKLMQQAQYLQYEKSNLPANQFSKFMITGQIPTKDQNGKPSTIRTSELDPRAFGVNYMSPDAKTKLLKQLQQNPTEFTNFEKSLNVAKDAGYIVLGQPNQQ